MELSRFWELVDLSRTGSQPDSGEARIEQQAGQLHALLSGLTADEVISFRDHFADQMIEAYRWDLWGAAFLVAGWCSDDSFADFRSWLISMGRNVFEQALADPDSLADVISQPGVETVFFEDFQVIPDRVFEELTGSQMPPFERPHPMSPLGSRWDPNGGELGRLLPRLWLNTRCGGGRRLLPESE